MKQFEHGVTSERVAVTYFDAAPDHGEWTCLCGNTSSDSGFQPCDGEGRNVEPDGAWEGLYRCDGCQRLIRQDAPVVEHPGGTVLGFVDDDRRRIVREVSRDAETALLGGWDWPEFEAEVDRRLARRRGVEQEMTQELARDADGDPENGPRTLPPIDEEEWEAEVQRRLVEPTEPDPLPTPTEQDAADAAIDALRAEDERRACQGRHPAGTGNGRTASTSGQANKLYGRLLDDLARSPHDERLLLAIDEYATIVHLYDDPTARTARLGAWLDKHADRGVDRPLVDKG